MADLKPFCCLECGAELAQTDGAVLVTPMFVVVQSTTLICRNCGTAHRWFAPAPVHSIYANPDTSDGKHRYRLAARDA